MAESRLHVYLSYRDPGAAVEWMSRLGFEATIRVHDEGGALLHAEVAVGSSCVLVGGYDDDYEPARLRRRSVGSGIYVTSDDPDADYERALDAGSRPVIVPEATPWGGRRARVLDPGGYEWTFGSYWPGSSAGEDSNEAIPSR